jgi:tetratricopeptide (TPR) repeat protein
MITVLEAIGYTILAYIGFRLAARLIRGLRSRISSGRKRRVGALKDAWAGLDRYEAGLDLETLDRAFKVVAAERAHRHANPWASVLEARAITLRSQRTGDDSDLREAVERAEAGLRRLPSKGPLVRTTLCPALRVVAQAHLMLAASAVMRGDEGLAREHFAVAEQRVQQALAHFGLSSPDAVVLVDDLGTVRIQRFEAFRERGDIDAAILDMEGVLRAHPVEEIGPFASTYRMNLGNALRVRYEVFGTREDLDRALIELESGTKSFADWVTLARTGHLPEAPVVSEYQEELAALEGQVQLGRGMYALALCQRYQRDETLQDLEQAVALTSDGSASVLLYARADALFLLSEATDDSRLLDQAVTAAEEAIERGMLSVDPVSMLMRVAQVRIMRFGRAGDLADLDRAEQVAAQLQQLRIGNRSDVLRILSVVAERRGITGRPDSVEEAVRYAEAALALDLDAGLEANSAVSAMRVAECLRPRYLFTGEARDLNRAIGLLRDARDRVPGFERAALLGLLADAHMLRYHKTHASEDLEAAAEVAASAIEAAASSAPAELPGARTILAQAIGERLDADLSVDRRADADHQIRLLRGILSETAPGWPFRPSALRVLALAYADQWREAGARADDLHEVFDLLDQAVAASAPTAVERVEILRSLAAIHREVFAKYGGAEHLELARQASDEALEILDARLLELPVSYRVGQQSSFAGVYEIALSTYVEWVRIRPAEAAASMIRAMLICERSKSRVLSQQLGAHGVPAPPDSDPAMLASEQRLVAELGTLDANEFARLGDATGGLRTLATGRRREVADELRRVWSALAETSGGADYAALRGGSTLGWDDLQSLARGLGEHTALLSLFLGHDRTYGFLLRAPWDMPLLVSGDELDAAAWQNVGRRLFRELHRPDPFGRLHMTWHQPLKPFLHAAEAHLADIDRVIVAPHGLGHVIPWTVAAEAGGWSAATVITTVPSFAALARIRDRDSVPGGGVLVVGDPRQDLRGAEQEARAVAEVHGVRALIGPHAVKETVQSRLKGTSLAHLATHAFFAAGSPLDSGIVLADGVLTAREVATAGSVPPLVILSACESGLSDRLGGDEIAGLAQAFLFAGARSLIVSLWKVDDPATSVLMQTLHTYLGNHADISIALRAGIDQVRADERRSPPYYWGAFIVQGDPMRRLS